MKKWDITDTEGNQRIIKHILKRYTLSYCKFENEWLIFLIGNTYEN